MSLQSLLFDKLFNSSLMVLRTYTKLPQGIKYYGFTYYPRNEKFEDPPYTPSKLFLVKRIKSMKGRTPKEKKTLKQLNLDGDKEYNGHITIVKNIPPINALLWKVKHIIDIKPISWDGELPKDGDYSGTYLRETGHLKIIPMLKVNQDILKLSEESNSENKKLTVKYLNEYLKQQWYKKANYVV